MNDGPPYSNLLNFLDEMEYCMTKQKASIEQRQLETHLNVISYLKGSI